MNFRMTAIAAMALACLGTPSWTSAGERRSEEVAVSKPGTMQLARLPDGASEGAGATLDEIRGGSAPVAPVAAQFLPESLPEIEATDERKRVFIKALLPAILNVMTDIERERRFLESIRRLEPARMTPGTRRHLRRLETQYGVEPGALDELLRRVDVVPVGLALAQAAIESGWGTSRFAQKGNALFGQRTYDPDTGGMLPRGYDGNPGFRVRSFDTVTDAVAAYVHNLNTHPSYAGFRALRARTRAEGEPLSAMQLAATLLEYSERGGDYIRDLQATIRANRMWEFRDARLAPGARRADPARLAAR